MKNYCNTVGKETAMNKKEYNRHDKQYRILFIMPEYRSDNAINF